VPPTRPLILFITALPTPSVIPLPLHLLDYLNNSNSLPAHAQRQPLHRQTSHYGSNSNSNSNSNLNLSDLNNNNVHSQSHINPFPPLATNGHTRRRQTLPSRSLSLRKKSTIAALQPAPS